MHCEIFVINRHSRQLRTTSLIRKIDRLICEFTSKLNRPPCLLPFTSVLDVIPGGCSIVRIVTERIEVIRFQPDFSGGLKFPDFAGRVDRVGVATAAAGSF